MTDFLHSKSKDPRRKTCLAFPSVSAAKQNIEGWIQNMSIAKQAKAHLDDSHQQMQAFAFFLPSVFVWMGCSFERESIREEVCANLVFYNKIACWSTWEEEAATNVQKIWKMTWYYQAHSARCLECWDSNKSTCPTPGVSCLDIRSSWANVIC